MQSIVGSIPRVQDGSAAHLLRLRHNAKQRPDRAAVAMVAADTAADDVARMSGGVSRVLYDGTIRHHLGHVFVQVEPHPHRRGEIGAGQADIIERVLAQRT